MRMAALLHTASASHVRVPGQPKTNTPQQLHECRWRHSRPDLRRVARSCSRSALLPWYSRAGQDGRKRLNSLTQLGRVDRGPTTMKGPGTVLLRMYAIKPMVWACELYEH